VPAGEGVFHAVGAAGYAYRYGGGYARRHNGAAL